MELFEMDSDAKHEADSLCRSGRSFAVSSASVNNRWDGLLTTEDLGGGSSAARSSPDAFHVDKDVLLQQIKNSFQLETSSFRSRILEATDEAARARDRIHDVQNEMLRLRKKCFKLQKMLQERDAAIATLQEQKELELPMLMHETLRSLHNNQTEEDDRPLQRSSVHRNRHQRSIIQEQMDERVHEYEKQISRLYEELHHEKEKNEMLRESLKEQKHAKAKLMKACKFAKREIDALKESDLSHLLEDMEIKCRELELRNATLHDDLDHERTQANNARVERDAIEEELEARRQDSIDWAARLEAKQREIERLRAQIHEQQSELETFQQDYDIVASRTAPRDTTDAQTELQQECDLLMRALHRERAHVAELEERLRTQTSQDRLQRSVAASRESDTSDESQQSMQREIGSVRDKIRRLHSRLVEYTETQGLSSSSGPRGFSSSRRLDERRFEATLDLSGRASDASVARGALSQCSSELDAMQRLMEEAFARALGNNCAMQ